MRLKGLFVTFYTEVLNVEDVKNKHNIFNYNIHRYAIKCNTLKEQNAVISKIISTNGIKNVRYANSVDISKFDVVSYESYENVNFFM
jgi:hypothetical protein